MLDIAIISSDLETLQLTPLSSGPSPVPDHDITHRHTYLDQIDHTHTQK